MNISYDSETVIPAIWKICLEFYKTLEVYAIRDPVPYVHDKHIRKNKKINIFLG